MTATYCPCSEQCELGYDDQFQPATRELMVFTKAAKRYFDLDAVRVPYTQPERIGKTQDNGRGAEYPPGASPRPGRPSDVKGNWSNRPNFTREDRGGAPPLDWWQIPSPKPQPISPYEGPPMTATMYIGDVLDVLSKLPENSVDLVLSSPPFLALRSYLPADHPDKEKEGGSQSTPGEYIDWLLDVVEACDRVLAPHGSLCFELGDTYAGSDGTFRYKPEDAPFDGFRSKTVASRSQSDGIDGTQNAVPRSGQGWPLPKSLSLIPESFRFAMVYGQNPFTGRQTDRWRLRNVIRWVRPNPPVGALGDKFRPATSELMVFCKSAKRYFDLDAVREPSIWKDRTYEYSPEAKQGPNRTSTTEVTNGFRRNVGSNPAGAPPLDWWNIPPGGYSGAHYAVWPEELLIKPIKAMCPEQVCRTCGEARRRIVKTEIASDERRALADYLRTQREEAGLSVKDVAAHFPSLTGGMTGCVWNWENGANVPTIEQWSILKRLLQLDDQFDSLVTGDRTWTDDPAEYIGGTVKPRISGDFMGSGSAGKVDGGITRISATLGFTDCGHDNYRNGVVLDPFVGSGTTLSVASGHGRDSIGIDLDERNYDLALERVGPLVLQRGEVAA